MKSARIWIQIEIYCFAFYLVSAIVFMAMISIRGMIGENTRQNQGLYKYDIDGYQTDALTFYRYDIDWFAMSFIMLCLSVYVLHQGRHGKLHKKGVKSDHFE